MSKLFKRIQRNAHRESERERGVSRGEGQRRGALIGGDRPTKGQDWTLSLNFSIALFQQRAGKLTEFPSSLAPAPAPASSPSSFRLTTSLCCRNEPSSGCFVAVTYGLFEQSRVGAQVPHFEKESERERAVEQCSPFGTIKAAAAGHANFWCCVNAAGHAHK